MWSCMIRVYENFSRFYFFCTPFFCSTQCFCVFVIFFYRFLHSLFYIFATRNLHFENLITRATVHSPLSIFIYPVASVYSFVVYGRPLFFYFFPSLFFSCEVNLLINSVSFIYSNKFSSIQFFRKETSEHRQL